MRKANVKDIRALEKEDAYLKRLRQENPLLSEDDLIALVEDQLAGRFNQSYEFSPQGPSEQAQHIMWDAFATDGRAKRIKMAEKALSVSSDCADAYVLLAEERAKSAEEALDLYKRAVVEGSKSLGQVFFVENRGKFRKKAETKPFLRALAGLAKTHWELDQCAQAFESWRNLFTLDPFDRFTASNYFAPALVHAGMLDEADLAIKNLCSEEYAATLYSKALLLYKQDKHSVSARTAIKTAVDYNPFVLEYILLLVELPKSAESRFIPREDGEARFYSLLWKKSWEDPARAWILEHMVRRQRKQEIQDVFPGLIK